MMDNYIIFKFKFVISGILLCYIHIYPDKDLSLNTCTLVQLLSENRCKITKLVKDVLLGILFYLRRSAPIK